MLGPGGARSRDRTPGSPNGPPRRLRGRSARRRRAMAQDADLWASTPGAWVSLADLPDTVERELRIIKSEAIRALRHPLEMGFVHARVEGWLDTSQQFEDSEDWVWSERIGGPDLIALEGWQHVNWNEGTLAGHPISVRWDHVVRELA